MKEDQISLRKFLEKYNTGEFAFPDVKIQIEAGWYDWFCKDSALMNKTFTLTKKLKQFVLIAKIDLDKNYVFFKNNCPMIGSLYDDFRICDLETGDVIWTVIPKRTQKNKTFSELWGKINEFQGPIIEGTWNDILNYFIDKEI